MRNAFGTFGDVIDCSEGIALAKHAEDSVTIVARSRPCAVHLVVNCGCREAAPQFLWQHFLARPVPTRLQPFCSRFPRPGTAD